MGRRSENLFKRNDVMRAVKAARDSGLPVAGVRVECKDGTVITVLGENTAQMQATQDNAAAAKPWDDATAAIEKSNRAPTKKVTRTAKR
jgi:hypothetical protein